MTDRRREFERWRRGRLPRLSEAGRVMLEAIALAAGGGLSEIRYHRAGGVEWVPWATNTRAYCAR